MDHAALGDPRAYLIRIVTRLALNRLRALARQREEYVGEWLPEPLLTSPDVAEDAGLAENVSIAMLTVLETLRPAERAVFVLREVFETPYHEIAQVVGKTPAAVRQIARRARERRAAKVPDFVATTAWLNGIPGARIDIGGAATAVSLVVEDGRITRICAIRNPHKLEWLERWRNCGGDRPKVARQATRSMAPFITRTRAPNTRR